MAWLTRQNCEHCLFQMNSLLVALTNSFSDDSRCAWDCRPSRGQRVAACAFCSRCFRHGSSTNAWSCSHCVSKCLMWPPRWARFRCPCAIDSTRLGLLVLPTDFGITSSSMITCSTFACCCFRCRCCWWCLVNIWIFLLRLGDRPVLQRIQAPEQRHVVQITLSHVDISQGWVRTRSERCAQDRVYPSHTPLAWSDRHCCHVLLA